MTHLSRVIGLKDFACAWQPSFYNNFLQAGGGGWPPCPLFGSATAHTNEPCLKCTWAITIYPFWEKQVVEKFLSRIVYFKGSCTRRRFVYLGLWNCNWERGNVTLFTSTTTPVYFKRISTLQNLWRHLLRIVYYFAVHRSRLAIIKYNSRKGCGHKLGVGASHSATMCK